MICVEELIVNTMSKNNEYNKSRMDASMSRLLHMLEYKAEWYGRTLVRVPHNYPSSQLCSKCGYKNSNMKNLGIRNWICPECGSIHDRDVNAAKNILNKGIEMLVKDGAHPDSLFMLGSLESSSKKSQ